MSTPQRQAMDAFVSSPRAWQLLVGSFFPVPGLPGVAQLREDLQEAAEQAFQRRDFQSGAILFGCVLRLRWTLPSGSTASLLSERFTNCWTELSTHPCRPGIDIALWLVEGLAARSGIQSAALDAIEQFLVSASPHERDIVLAAMKRWDTPSERLMR